MDVLFGHKGWLILRLLSPPLSTLSSINKLTLTGEPGFVWFSTSPSKQPNRNGLSCSFIDFLLLGMGDQFLLLSCENGLDVTIYLSIKHMVSTECKKFCLLMRRLLREIRSGPALRSLPFVAERRQHRGQVDLCREGRIVRDTVAILSFPLIFQEACVSALGFRGIP